MKKLVCNKCGQSESFLASSREATECLVDGYKCWLETKSYIDWQLIDGTEFECAVKGCTGYGVEQEIPEPLPEVVQSAIDKVLAAEHHAKVEEETQQRFAQEAFRRLIEHFKNQYNMTVYSINYLPTGGQFSVDVTMFGTTFTYTVGYDSTYNYMNRLFYKFPRYMNVEAGECLGSVRNGFREPEDLYKAFQRNLETLAKHARELQLKQTEARNEKGIPSRPAEPQDPS